MNKNILNKKKISLFSIFKKLIIILFFLILIIISYKIYSESDFFHLTCIVSDKDSNTYCVRERKNMEGSADLLADVITMLVIKNYNCG